MYSENDYRNYLTHHGIKGQKWGVRNGPPYPLDYESHSTIEKSESDKALFKDISNNYVSANLSKWGKSKDTNVLYITGTSGSGKSTVADKLADKTGAQVIHLDPYLGMMSKESRNAYQNKDFNKFLSKEVPEYRKVVKDNTGKLDYRIVDKIASASEKYGRNKYGKERVIIEGVQLFDQTFYEDRSFYKEKPVLAIKTNPIVSNWRGSVRDSDHIFDTASLFVYRLPMTYATSKTVKEFEKELRLS